MDDFRFRELRPVGKRVHRLGLSLNYGIDADGLRAAADRGVGRFCLSSPHVDVTLCGARSLAELDQNLAAIEKGPLAADDAWMRDFGKVVHDRGPKLAWSF
jgi:hypothetical protein